MQFSRTGRVMYTNHTDNTYSAEDRPSVHDNAGPITLDLPEVGTQDRAALTYGKFVN